MSSVFNQPGAHGAYTPAFQATNMGPMRCNQTRTLSYTLLDGEFTFLVTAEGHVERDPLTLLGGTVAKTVAFTMKEFLVEQTRVKGGDIGGAEMSEMLRAAFQHACVEADGICAQPACEEEVKRCRPGCTVAAVLVNHTRLNCFASLQLGDCFAMLINAATGEVKWETQENYFTDPNELDRYGEAGSMKVETISPRKNTFEEERRVDTIINFVEGPNQGLSIPVPEAARVLKCGDFLPEELKQTQRVPVVDFMPLPVSPDPLAFVFGTPGPFYKNPFGPPDPKCDTDQRKVRLARFLARPSSQMCDDYRWLMKDTGLQKLWTDCPDLWKNYSRQCEQGEDWLKQCKMRVCHIVPDQNWKEAVDRAYKEILKSGVLEKNVTLLSNTQAALNALVHFATMVLSDNTVSIGALVFVPKAAAKAVAAGEM